MRVGKADAPLEATQPERSRAELRVEEDSLGSQVAVQDVLLVKELEPVGDELQPLPELAPGAGVLVRQPSELSSAAKRVG